MSNGRAMIIFLTVGLIKKISLYKLSYFPEPNTLSKSQIEVELDLETYAAKSDWKNATGVDASEFAENTDLASFKPNIE